MAPENRHSLHYSTIRAYNDGQVTCSVSGHGGQHPCEHKIIWRDACNQSLKDLKQKYDKNWKEINVKDAEPLVKSCVS